MIIFMCCFYVRELFVRWKAFMNVMPNCTKEMSDSDILLQHSNISYLLLAVLGDTQVKGRFFTRLEQWRFVECALIWTNITLCYWFLTRDLIRVWSDGAFGVCVVACRVAECLGSCRKAAESRTLKRRLDWNLQTTGPGLSLAALCRLLL